MKLTITSETQHADLIVDLLPDGFVSMRVEDHYRLAGAGGRGAFLLTPDQAQTLLMLLDYHTSVPEEEEEE